MQRVDLYTSVHKGLRTLFFQTLLEIARTDFAQADQARRAAGSLRRLLGFLHEHAEHEDEAILPELEQLAPELHAELRAEHARTGGLEGELEGLALRLAEAGPAERESLGARMHERLGLLAAEHLRHMAREEREANRVLWAHRSDAELAVIEGRIVGGIRPERLAEWLALMLPAVSRPERAALLAGMRMEMPAEVFEALTAPARGLLGEHEWEASLAPLAVR